MKGERLIVKFETQDIQFAIHYALAHYVNEIIKSIEETEGPNIRKDELLYSLRQNITEIEQECALIEANILLK